MLNSMSPRPGFSRSMAVVATAAAAALVLTACAGGSSSDEGSEAVTLKVATLYGPENWQTEAMKTYTDAVVEASDGELAFEYYYGDSLVTADGMASGLRDGVIDIANIVPTYTPADFPVDEWASGLAYMADESPVAGYMQGVAATLEWSFEDEDYYSSIADQGLEPLVPRFLVHHKYGILCSDENKTLDQLSGLRTRVGSPAHTGEAEALGMVPTSVSGPETYSAFQQGLLDCTWTNVPDMVGLSLPDHAKHYNDAGLLGFSSQSLAMGANKWDSLSPEAQEALWSQLPVFIESMMEGNMQEHIDARSMEDMNWVRPDAATTALVEDYHRGLEKSLMDNAPSDVSDPSASVASLKSAHEAWRDEVEELGFSFDTVDWSAQIEDHGQDVPDIGPWVEKMTTEILDEHAAR